VRASPGRNLFRNNDEHGPPGLGRTLRSGQQLNERDKDECRFTDDRETGTTHDCRHGQHVALMNNIQTARYFLLALMLSINRDHGVRLEHQTLAMIRQAKRLTPNAIVIVNTGLWPNSCESGNLLKI
jgi:hypothetical protein